MRTKTAIAAFLEDCKYEGLAEKSIDGYGWALNKLEAAFPRELPTTPQEIKRLLIDQVGLNQESRFDLWRRLCRLWTWLEREHGVKHVIIRERGPNSVVWFVSPPRRRKRIPRTLELHEIERLLITTKARREKAMIALILDTGIRVGELANLRWPDVTAAGVRVCGKTGQRFLPVTPKVRQYMLGLGDGYHIWMGRPEPLSGSGCQQVIRRAMYAAGFQPPKAGPHMLRHTFGRHWITGNGDVFSLQRILGHSNVSTTMLYVTLSTGDLESQHSKFSPMRALALEGGAIQQQLM